MIKRTLYFGNPAYLSTQNEQINIKIDDKITNIPIEDIGVLIIDHQQITVTSTLISKLLEHNVAMITCNEKHHPTGMMLNLDGHTKQSKLFKHQLEASEPLKKQLWKQTIVTKIENQAVVLSLKEVPNPYLINLSKEVKTADSTNCEAQAAAYYWKHLFDFSFKRERFGEAPNHVFNYGYAILRAIVARNLVGSGLLPTLGIFHRNQYNAYCLADDIMEPYRPIVDNYILTLLEIHELTEELSKELKVGLLQIPVLDVKIGQAKRPLMVAVQETTASLAKCFEGKEKKIKYPKLI